jgi:adenine deaminase
MSTINPAIYLKIDHELGAIAPGRIADILVTESLEKPTPEFVVKDGQLIVDQGRSIFNPSPLLTIRDEGKPFLMKGAKNDMFDVKAPFDHKLGIPVISISDKTVTSRKDMFLPVRDGFVVADPQRDVFKIAAILRNGNAWNCGFVTGLGFDIDAMATSVCHETHEILVIGREDKAMCNALDRLLEIKGGVIFVKGGRVIHKLPLPIGGTMSEKPLDVLAKDLSNTKEILISLGCPLEEPLWTVGFLTFTSIVDIRMTISGVYDVRKGEIIFNSLVPVF